MIYNYAMIWDFALSMPGYALSIVKNIAKCNAGA
jgi:hypothetical protein